jgi:hypothetical protein
MFGKPRIIHIGHGLIARNNEAHEDAAQVFKKVRLLEAGINEMLLHSVLCKNKRVAVIPVKYML